MGGLFGGSSGGGGGSGGFSAGIGGGDGTVNYSDGTNGRPAGIAGGNEAVDWWMQQIADGKIQPGTPYDPTRYWNAMAKEQGGYSGASSTMAGGGAPKMGSGSSSGSGGKTQNMSTRR